MPSRRCLSEGAFRSDHKNRLLSLENDLRISKKVSNVDASEVYKNLFVSKLVKNFWRSKRASLAQISSEKLSSLLKSVSLLHNSPSFVEFSFDLLSKLFDSSSRLITGRQERKTERN